MEIKEAYTFEGKSICIGNGIIDGKINEDLKVNIPLKTLNRHGLIAGATGTGKTKTLQKFAESLSDSGISVLMMDIKGDVSGICKPGVENDKIKSRVSSLGISWKPQAYPAELLTISNTAGVKLRATVTEFGPVLFSKILELNENQSGVVSLVFKYSDDNDLPILDLKDFRKVNHYHRNT